VKKIASKSQRTIHKNQYRLWSIGPKNWGLDHLSSHSLL